MGLAVAIPLAEFRYEFLKLHASPEEREVRFIGDRVVRWPPHPCLALVRVPTDPVRFVDADGVTKIDGQTTPERLDLIAIHGETPGHVLNRDPILTFQIDKEHADATLTAGRLGHD